MILSIVKKSLYRNTGQKFFRHLHFGLKQKQIVWYNVYLQISGIKIPSLVSGLILGGNWLPSPPEILLHSSEPQLLYLDLENRLDQFIISTIRSPTTIFRPGEQIRLVYNLFHQISSSIFKAGEQIRLVYNLFHQISSYYIQTWRIDQISL